MGTSYSLLGSAAEGMDAPLHAQHGEKHSARDVRTERSGRLGKYLRNEEQRDVWLLEGSWLEVLLCNGSRRGHCSLPPSCALRRIWGESGSSLSCHGVEVLCSAPSRGCTSGRDLIPKHQARPTLPSQNTFPRRVLCRGTLTPLLQTCETQLVHLARSLRTDPRAWA